MCGDKTNENSEQHSQDKWYDHKPTKLTIAIATLIIYSLFVIVDAHDIWPWSRITALSVGVPATIAVLYAEAFATDAISFRAFLVCSAVVICGGPVIYFAIPQPASEAPQPTIGWLQPANEPTPDNGCGSVPVPILVLGDTGFIPKSLKEGFTVLQIGSCTPTTIQQGPYGIAVSTDLYSKKGEFIGTLRNNGYTVTGDKKLIVERSGDLSTLVVHDPDGVELLYVRYLNPSAIQLRGIFACPTPRLTGLVVTNDKIMASSRGFLSHGCMAGSTGTGIRVE